MKKGGYFSREDNIRGRSLFKEIWYSISFNKTVFLGLSTFSNVNVVHKGLLLQDLVYRLGMESFYTYTRISLNVLCGQKE